MGGFDRGDLNRHVGEVSDGYEDVHGGFCFRMRKKDGEMIWEFCVAA